MRWMRLTLGVFFKQKTAYEMRISDWSSDVCSSDLGQNDQVDLRELVRRNDDDDLLDAALDGAMAIKPKGHDFSIAKGAAPAVSRHMSVTGGSSEDEKHGRASSRERVCQYGEISVVAVSLEKKTRQQSTTVRRNT